MVWYRTGVGDRGETFERVLDDERVGGNINTTQQSVSCSEMFRGNAPRKCSEGTYRDVTVKNNMHITSVASSRNLEISESRNLGISESQRSNAVPRFVVCFFKFV
jgi:hypothetical protein